MKSHIKYIFKISILIALIVFIIERALTNNGFNLNANELFKVFSIHFMYAFVLTLINAHFYDFLNSKFSWKKHSKKRLIIGAAGSIALTMIGLVLLRFISIVLINGKPVDNFLNDKYAFGYYTFGLVITLIISLVFHSIYFYKALTEDKVKEQQIVAKTETAKYESLKSQIDPHFLFNSLNVLTSLIGENPIQAEKFTTKLSKVYRYVLEQKSKDLVSLDEELHFAKTYMELLKMRFENAVTFEIPEAASNSELKIIPLSLQLLLENSIKHNVVSEENPLKVVIHEEDGFLIVNNNFKPKKILEQGTKVGLKNIIERYNLITLKKVVVEKTLEDFTVKLPLLTQKTTLMKTSNTQQYNRYSKAVERVEEIKGFYGSLIAYCLVIPFLIFINLKYVPQFHWFWFPAMGWGIGLIFQGFKAFAYNPFLGNDWEERKIQEFMNKDKKQYWE
ncbi:MAG: Pr2TM family membrane protein [Lutibacter sp.]|uniref:2TM domain-containing protein n=1 Tax=Lutibacter sp. TaxID=1925666 RepID=UPI001842B6ED|nr:2TM domain-containing protein [Lutibacter sp.]MBT8317019.1 2TM domain-containing protein [Lutibacter sp.]NNJ57879.1 Pr2TM family membrane protein [Lutibacter sp.]